MQAFISLSMQEEMHESCDVAVIGGAFSGATTALLLRREAPELRVVVIERSKQFDRKVGEATTEVSGCFLTKRLALTHHLCHHHVVKNGLRFWFSRGSDDDFDRCGELGAFYQVRLPSYQVDREVLDEHVLSLAREAGALSWIDAVHYAASVNSLRAGSLTPAVGRACFPEGSGCGALCPSIPRMRFGRVFGM